MFMAFCIQLKLIIKKSDFINRYQFILPLAIQNRKHKLILFKKLKTYSMKIKNISIKKLTTLLKYSYQICDFVYLLQS